MEPQTPTPNPIPVPGNSYDFILQPKKPGLHIPGMGSSFVAKVVALLVGVVFIGIAFWFVGNLFSTPKINTADLTSLIQMENEIVRIAGTGKGASLQTTKNMAMNSKLSVKTHQNQWTSILSKEGVQLNDKQLALTHKAITDTRLTAAKQNGTFDLVLAQTMDSQLTEYARTLQADYQKATGATEKAVLKAHYNQTLLLLEQVPKPPL